MTRPSADPVVIRTFQVEHEADLACAILEAHGVRAVILRDNAGGMLPVLQALFQIRLVVAPEDADLARRILEASAEEMPEE